MTFLGDVVPYQGFKSSVLDDASLLVFNLETPIIRTQASAARKAGPHLSSNELVLPLTHSDSVIAANLANNHMMDYGYDGLMHTFAECSKQNVLVVGAGENVEKARMPVIVEVGSKTIGIIGCCDAQFGAATSRKPGVANIGHWIHSAIERARNRADTTIISIHGGSEMSPWPSPEWQELLRSFVDSGADIVHGHHSHVPQGYEEYNNGLIFYSLGSFGADPEYWRDEPNALWSIIPEIEVDNQRVKYKINTSVASDGGDHQILVRRSKPEEFTKHSEYLEQCNKPLRDKKLLTAIWQDISIRMYFKAYAQYLNFPEANQCGKAWMKKSAQYVLAGIKECFGGKRHSLIKSTRGELLLWYHLFACETHKGSIANALGVLSGELDDLRTDETRALVDEMMPSLCDRQASRRPNNA